MAEFDPYLKWLGIRDPARPPHHYALLGLALFETDGDVIAHAADRQMAHVKTFQTGAYAAWSQRLLNELAAARLCLLDPARRQRYDAELRAQLASAASQWADTVEVPAEEVADVGTENRLAGDVGTSPASTSKPQVVPPGAEGTGTEWPTIRTAEPSPRIRGQRRRAVGWAVLAGACGLAVLAGLGWELLHRSGRSTPGPTAARPREVVPPAEPVAPPAAMDEPVPPSTVADDSSAANPPSADDSAPESESPADVAPADATIARGLAQVERALIERRIDEAAALLDAIPRPAVPAAQQARWETLSWRAGQLRRVWEALREACRNLGSNAKLNQGKQSWAILGFENDALRIAQAEGEARLPLVNLPAGTLADLAQSVLATRAPEEQASLAVFLAGDREPDRDRALAVLSACARQGWDAEEFAARLGLPVAAVATTNTAPPVAPSAPADNAPPTHAQLAYPDASVLQAARAKVRETLADRFAAAREVPDQEILIRDLVRAAVGDAVAPAERAAAFAEALELAQVAAQPALAYEVLSARAEWFSADLLAERLQALEAVLRPGVSADAVDEISHRSLELVEQALEEDRYELAEQAAQLGVAAARRRRDLAGRERARLAQEEVRAQQARWKQVRPASEAVQSGRSSPVDRGLLGVFRCLEQGRWDDGLPLLAEGDDASLAELARRELTGPGDWEAQLEIAHGWWKYQASLPQRTRKRAATHAADWYQRALPALTGVERTRAESRLQEAAQLAGTSAAGRGPGQRELPTLRVLPLPNGLEIKFRLVRPGAFRMGLTGQSRLVTLTKPFYLAETELTQPQWEAVLDSNPSRLRSLGANKLPVNNVSWQDCQAWLAAVNGKLPADSGALRLPTEAEWEYACRAGSGGEFSFGDDASQLIAFGWFYPDNAAGRPHEVGTLEPNAWGFFDMHGNLLEWCHDWNAELPLTSLLDPGGPAGGSQKSLRGGSFAHRADDCRAGARQRAEPQRREVYFGLRPAWDAP